jgi:hypothetical protein
MREALHDAVQGLFIFAALTPVVTPAKVFRRGDELGEAGSEN